jgi:hypothetical protein
MDALSFEPNQTTTFLLISLRMGGMIFFNPIFGRKSIPAMVKVGLSLGLALAAFPLGATGGFDDLSHASAPALHGEGSLCRLPDRRHRLAVYVHLPHRRQCDGPADRLGMATLYRSGEQLADVAHGEHRHYPVQPPVLHHEQPRPPPGHRSSVLLHRTARTPADAAAAAIYVVEMFSHILAYAIQLALPIIVTQIVVEVAVVS